jgi:hypothetical protein
MRLIISQFLRTLRERDEFDRLLPDLLLTMGYVPLAKPQTGVRQYGVDVAAAGKSPVDDEDELLLFVIKQGDLGRRDWDNPEPTAIRSSLNEVLDVYLTKMVPPEYSSFRKVVVLATTGDLKQDVEFNWTSYKEQNAQKACFDFWGADKVSNLIERHMLNENLFAAEDRSDLRKSLALAAAPEYEFQDFKRLLLRQLGMTPKGKVVDTGVTSNQLQKVFKRVHLAALICAHWAQTDGDSRKALWIMERTLLWSWHRLLLLEQKEQKLFHSMIFAMRRSHAEIGAEYFQVIGPHLGAKDGMAGYGTEGAAFSMVLFEHIGLISTLGLAYALEPRETAEENQLVASSVMAIADGLCALIENHEASASPRLDAHIIDIALALVFLLLAGRTEAVQIWLSHIAVRLDFCFKSRSGFPVGTDSLEDLAELQVNPTERLTANLMQTSWCLATVAGWCTILGLNEHYAAIVEGATHAYKEVCAQLWHPTADWPERWYFENALDTGNTEAPYVLPAEASELRQRMTNFLTLDAYDWPAASPSRAVDLFVLDFIACRHFRMPVPASMWYRFLDMQAPKAVGT